ncbi:class I SAM-dependent methyltransferase [Candidatus Bathyarchaeota archaeon]|nr:class I SAM-dependent methyltransferase [Candidatus Bathyarchaeota archaeon]
MDLEKLYDEEAGRYDADRLSGSAGKVKHNVEIKKIGKILGKTLGKLDGRRILEVGVGTGRIAVELAAKGATVYGLDVSTKMLEETERKAKERGVQVRVVKGSGERLPFRDAQFDAVIIMRVLAHVKAPKKFVEEAKRVTKPGGTLVFDFYNADNYFIRRGEKRNKEQGKYIPRSFSKKDVVGFLPGVKIEPTQYMLTLGFLPFHVYYVLETLLSLLPDRLARNLIYYYTKEL